MKWKYGMILVAKNGEQHPGYESVSHLLDEDLCALVELYETPSQPDVYHSFCATEILSIKDLKRALCDIEGDGGVNTWFYENGKFRWDSVRREWDWEPNAQDRA